MDSTASEDITPENIIRKLLLYDKSQVSKICLVARQEIERLREERERYRSALLHLRYMVGAEIVTPSIAQAMRELINKALASEPIINQKHEG